MRRAATGLIAWLIVAAVPAGAAAQDAGCTRDEPKATIEACTGVLAERGLDEGRLFAALVGRAEAHAELGDCPRAIVDLTSALEIDPAAAGALGLRGDCRLRQSDFDGAIADITASIAQSPERPFAHSQRAMAWAAKGEALLALQDMSTAIDLARRHSGSTAGDLYYNALGHYWRHDHESAVQVLDRALAADPRHKPSFSLRADARMTLGDPRRAVEDYTQAIALAPTEPNGYVGRGEAHTKTGDKDAATKDLERALALLADAKDASGLNSRAWTLHLLGRHDAALGDAMEALRRLPNEPNLLHTRGRILEALGRVSEALSDYRTALRFDPGHPHTLEEMRRLGEVPPRRRAR